MNNDVYKATNELWKALNLIKGFEVGMKDGPKSGKIYLEFEGDVYTITAEKYRSNTTIEKVFNM